jgi:hypothetical protein
MQHPVHDEELFMEEAMAAIRRAITDEDAGEMTLAPAEPRTSGEGSGVKQIPRLALRVADNPEFAHLGSLTSQRSAS